MTATYKLIMLSLVVVLMGPGAIGGGEAELEQAVQEFEGKQKENTGQLLEQKQQSPDKNPPILEEDSIKSLDDEPGDSVAVTGFKFGFFHAFLASISVIIVSEIGDKTFFIAAILAMTSSRLLVFTGALSALAFMTFLSVCLGYATVIIPRWVTFYICTLLLVIFGLKMLYEGWHMKPDEGLEEFEEVSAELKRKEEPAATDPEQGVSITTKPPFYRRLYFLSCLPSIILKSFVLTFLAEWGDRSQLTTIVLSAREDPFGVIIGGTLGHALCTALAVLGGKIIAQRISVRTVTLIGGMVFLLFAVTAFLHNPESEVS